MKKIERLRDACLWVIVGAAAFAFVDSSLQDMTRNDCTAGIQRACAHVRSQAR